MMRLLALGVPPLAISVPCSNTSGEPSKGKPTKEWTYRIAPAYERRDSNSDCRNNLFDGVWTDADNLPAGPVLAQPGTHETGRHRALMQPAMAWAVVVDAAARCNLDREDPRGGLI